MLTCNTNQYTTAQVLAGSADSTTESFATSLAQWLKGTSPTGHRGAGRRQTRLHPPVLGGERRDQRQHAHGGDPVRRRA
jgi:hypothetical protein